MLDINRRHRKRCKHRHEGRLWRHCDCPIHVDGFLGGRRLRKTMGTRNWTLAIGTIRDWEIAGRIVEEEQPQQLTTVTDARKAFLADAKARNLRPPTLYKYDLLLRQLQKFADNAGLTVINQFDLSTLRNFRESWPNRNIAGKKKLEALRTFFQFCREGGWMTQNPAMMLKAPKTSTPPTLPFSDEEMNRILAACSQYSANYGGTGHANARRLRALVLLLENSGLRIRDAVTLRRDRIDDKGNLFLHTAKTGTPVKLPLPPAVVEALSNVIGTNSQYFFWTGESKPKSAVGDWQRSLRKLFRLASIPNGHPHRFRHTFAARLLQAGASLENVSRLLGHQSTRITEKYYAPWIKERQEQLEADVRRTWSASSPLPHGTPLAHGVGNGHIN
jgi:integrase/recombinase XerD